MTDKYKRYIGDAVYAAFDGYHIILTVEDGIKATNRIALEPAVYNALVKYRGDLQAMVDADHK